jgi:hypothetical protein
MDSILPTAVLSASSLLNNLLSSAKNARELVKLSSDAALKEQIGDLLEAVLEVKIRVIDLDEENRRLREQIARKQSLTRDSTFGYWKSADDPDPVCPKCWEGAGKVCFLSPIEMTDSGATRRSCRQCEHQYWESRPSPTLPTPSARRRP